jgi:hypothetical protein
MSQFFESEVIRSEMVELQELQDEVYSKIFHFPQMSTDDKIEHVEKLELLLEKQRIFYTRLSLSDDPQAKMMKENITKSAQMMGMPQNVDMNLVFGNMSKMLDHMKKQIDIPS